MHNKVHHTVVLYIRDHEGLLPHKKSIDQKPASQYLYGTLTVLVTSPKEPSVA